MGCVRANLLCALLGVNRVLWPSSRRSVPCIRQGSPAVCSASVDSWRDRRWRGCGDGPTDSPAAWSWFHRGSLGTWWLGSAWIGRWNSYFLKVVTWNGPASKIHINTGVLLHVYILRWGTIRKHDNCAFSRLPQCKYVTRPRPKTQGLVVGLQVHVYVTMHMQTAALLNCQVHPEFPFAKP